MSTRVQSSQPSSSPSGELTWSCGGTPVVSTGVRVSVNRCPATPSANPSASFWMMSACTPGAVPPMTQAVSPSMTGEEL